MNCSVASGKNIAVLNPSLFTQPGRKHLGYTTLHCLGWIHLNPVPVSLWASSCFILPLLPANFQNPANPIPWVTPTQSGVRWSLGLKQVSVKGAFPQPLPVLLLKVLAHADSYSYKHGSLFGDHPVQGSQSLGQPCWEGPVCSVRMSSTSLVRMSEGNQFSCQPRLCQVTKRDCISSVWDVWSCNAPHSALLLIHVFSKPLVGFCSVQKAKDRKCSPGRGIKTSLGVQPHCGRAVCLGPPLPTESRAWESAHSHHGLSSSCIPSTSPGCRLLESGLWRGSAELVLGLLWAAQHFYLLFRDYLSMAKSLPFLSMHRA